AAGRSGPRRSRVVQYERAGAELREPTGARDHAVESGNRAAARVDGAAARAERDRPVRREADVRHQGERAAARRIAERERRVLDAERAVGPDEQRAVAADDGAAVVEVIGAGQRQQAAARDVQRAELVEELAVVVDVAVPGDRPARRDAQRAVGADVEILVERRVAGDGQRRVGVERHVVRAEVPLVGHLERAAADHRPARVRVVAGKHQRAVAALPEAPPAVRLAVASLVRDVVFDGDDGAGCNIELERADAGEEDAGAEGEPGRAIARTGAGRDRAAGDPEVVEDLDGTAVFDEERAAEARAAAGAGQPAVASVRTADTGRDG